MAALSPVIQLEDVNRLWYGLAVTKAGRDALASVFMWSYRGTFPVGTYLTQDLGYTNTQYKRIFDDYQRDKLEASSDAATFDITLLYKLLQHVCGLAKMNDPTWTTPGPQGPSLEHLIYSLKQHRNTLAHDNVRMSEQDLTSTLTELSDLLAKMLAEAGDRCRTNSQDVSHVTRDVKEYIGALLEKVREPLDPSDVAHLSQFNQDNKKYKSYITEKVKQTSKWELTEVYKLLYQILPAPWLHLNINYNPSLAFTKLRLLENPVIGARPSHATKGQDNTRPSHATRNRDINYEDILSMRREDGRVPQCVLLTGEGGMGKTTLLKLILEKWVEDPAAIRHLGTEDLVFYVQCRNTHLNTFDDLLRQLLPQTLRDSDADFILFKETILSLNILVLIDGYDEVNKYSRRLVKELLHLPGKDVRLVITTRPGWDQQLSLLVPHTRPCYNILVLGITPERHAEFAERITKVLVEEESQQSVKEKFTQRLEQMSEFLGEYLNTPLTLILLALLCVEAPEEFNSLTTNTQVYEKIHDFITKKLVSRLIDQVTDPKRSCEKFLRFFEEVSLRGIKRQEYDLWPETEAEIREKCDTLGLPQEEVLSNYLTRTSYRRGLDVVTVFGYFHARYQEYCASRGLVAQLRKEGEGDYREQQCVSEKSSRITDLLKDVVHTQIGFSPDHLQKSDVTTDEIVERSRWQSILLSTTGVLSAQGVEHKFITHIVDLLCEMGKKSIDDELLKHVAESRESKHVIQAVCEKLRTKHKWSISSVLSCVFLPPVLREVTPEEIFLCLDDTPQLNQLLSALSELANNVVTIDIQFEGPLYSRNNDLSYKFLERLTAPGSQCTLKWFKGYLSEAAIPLLPHTLEVLDLRLTLHQLPVFIHHLPSLPSLEDLEITVDAREDTELTNMPSQLYKGRKLKVTISPALTADNPLIDWCCQLTAQLCPSTFGGYDVLDLTLKDLTSEKGKRLLRELHRRGVKGNCLCLTIKDNKRKKKELKNVGVSFKNFKHLHVV
ncbi:uncharacterized protein [Procambarus clarkii]|uniref:uncharacterized protein isoform X1 n=1 Tax=Procambarus clarkii TaxID=6728 RepID=UPI0037432157